MWQVMEGTPWEFPMSYNNSIINYVICCCCSCGCYIIIIQHSSCEPRSSHCTVMYIIYRTHLCEYRVDVLYIAVYTKKRLRAVFAAVVL